MWPTYTRPSEGGKERLLGVKVLCLFSTYDQWPLNLFKSANTTRVGKKANKMPNEVWEYQWQHLERHLESENGWQQHSFSVPLRRRDKEISRVSSLSASSLAAQIQSLWLNADDRTCACTWHAPLLGWSTTGCHPIPRIKKELPMSA